MAYDWHAAVEKALKRKRFLKKEKDLAASWSACAVGEAHEHAIEKGEDFDSDDTVSAVGIGFYAAVRGDMTGEAHALLKILDHHLAESRKDPAA